MKTKLEMYVVIEGPDGSGKTAVVKQVAEALRKTGLTCAAVREPGGTAFGEDLRDLILHNPHVNSVPATAIAFLFAAGSYAVSSAASTMGCQVLLSDRWAPISSRAYQVNKANSIEEALGLENLWKHYVGTLTPKQLAPVTHNPSRRPDLLIYLQTSPEEARYRRMDANRRDGIGVDNMDNQSQDDAFGRFILYEEMFRGPSLYGIPRIIINTDSRSMDLVASHVIDSIFLSMTKEQSTRLGVNRLEL